MSVYVPPPNQQTAAIASLKTTGRLPDNPYWNMVTARHDLNATRFDKYHPTLSVLLDRKGCLGPLVSDKLLKEYQQNYKKFERTHTAWITKLVKTEIYLKQHPIVCGYEHVIVPPPNSSPLCVPEPASITLFGVGILMLITLKLCHKQRLI